MWTERRRKNGLHTQTHTQLFHCIVTVAVDLYHALLVTRVAVRVGSHKWANVCVEIAHGLNAVPPFSMKDRLGETAAILDLISQVGRPLVVGRSSTLLGSGKKHDQLELWLAWRGHGTIQRAVWGQGVEKGQRWQEEGAGSWAQAIQQEIQSGLANRVIILFLVEHSTHTHVNQRPREQVTHTEH